MSLLQDTVIILFIDGCSFLFITHLFNMWRLYYISVCLYKIFQRTYSRLEAKASAKLRALFLLSKFFRSFFWKIFQSRHPTSRLSRSLASGKVRYRSGLLFYSAASACQINVFPSRKRMQRYIFFVSCNTLCKLFSKKVCIKNI